MTDQPFQYCCEVMEHDLTGTCDQHSRLECPDFFFTYSAKVDEYGLMRPDGLSIVRIRHCPFCGTRFPESKRDEWFDRLEALGFEDPLFDDTIPEDYKTAAWWRQTEAHNAS